MQINSSMFRAYDVRGVYGKDLTEDVMEAIGNAFASKFVKDSVVVGMDGRVSGPALKDAFIRGAAKAGKNEHSGECDCRRKSLPLQAW